MSLIKSISGIRGTIGGLAGENLTPFDVVKFSAAYIKFLRSKYPDEVLNVIVGRDARLSGEIISRLVCATLQSMGVQVFDVGLSTTPTVEMTVISFQAQGGIIITASHNPMEWNALKLLNSQGEFISAAEGVLLLEIAEKQDVEFAKLNKLGSYHFYQNAINDHIEKIISLDLVDTDAIKQAGFSVIIDCVNSTGGIALEPLLKQLGVNKVKILYGEPTGVFPHNPEPIPEHLYDIAAEMKKNSFDVGFVVDPDVDRLAILTEDGEMFGEEYTLVAVSDYVLQNTLGNTVSNLSSTRALRDISTKYGVQYSASAVGEVNVVEMMKATDAIIGGEGNGGVIYPKLHYGRDALVGIALFLSYMAKSKLACSNIRRKYPSYFISKNRIELLPEMNVADILDYIAKKYEDYEVNRIDGVKIDFEDCWIHLRSSNTEPIIRIYSEAITESVAQNLSNKILLDIREYLNR